MALQSAGSVVAATPAVVQLNQLYAVVVSPGMLVQMPSVAMRVPCAIGVPVTVGTDVRKGFAPPTTLVDAEYASAVFSEFAAVTLILRKLP
jgi:hypothetical protein